eukprot:9729544-Ditylum_brightwellii.AAC.1
MLRFGPEVGHHFHTLPLQNPSIRDRNSLDRNHFLELTPLYGHRTWVTYKVSKPDRSQKQAPLLKTSRAT